MLRLALLPMQAVFSMTSPSAPVASGKEQELIASPWRKVLGRECSLFCWSWNGKTVQISSWIMNAGKNMYSKHLTLVYLVQLVCLKIFTTSHGCFLEHWTHPLTTGIIANWVRKMFAPWGLSVYLFIFALRLEQNQFGGISKQRGRWKRNSTFELEIRHEQCPRLDCSETGDYVFDHNANSTLSQGGKETWVNIIEKYGSPLSIFTALG